MRDNEEASVRDPSHQQTPAAEATRSHPGKVYLVGAGPGDPDLITVRGQQLLQCCDALVYDSLVSPSLVSGCPAPLKHYVGKTQGGHALTQEEITRLLVDLAIRPGGPERIVRLKGGDPFVFGRGGEEALACQQAGVGFEVVPGVTAGVAAPAYAGVPVTHRSLSRGLVLFTGHLAHGNLEHLPWKALADSGFTLVSYMGVSTLPEIVRRLVAEGLSPDTPAMVVQEGTTPGQRSVSAPLGELPAEARRAGIRAPAVTVVGPVVGLGQALGPQAPRPLAGKTVVLLKAEESSYPELDAMRREGARVIEAPVLRCVAVPDCGGLEVALGAIRGEDVVLLTSAVAARFFGEAWHRQPSRPQPQVIAAARSVREAALRQGLEVVDLPEAQGDSPDQVLTAAGVPRDRTVWLPRSEAAGLVTVEAVERAGYRARPLPIYRVAPVPLPADVAALLGSGRADAVAFLSGTTVRAALSAAPGLRACQGVLFGAVGPVAAQVASELGIQCQVVPHKARVADLIRDLSDHLKVDPVGSVASRALPL